MRKLFRKLSGFCFQLKRLNIAEAGAAGCRCLHLATYTDSERARDFDLAAPNCLCEAHRLSKWSPSPVASAERLDRFVFSPMHVSRDQLKVKPSIFSHAESFGCSVQRRNIATKSELEAFLTGFLREKADRAWIGALIGNAGAMRLAGKATESKALCIYDSGERTNPAHAEFVWTGYPIDEADRLELRKHLFDVFGGGIMVKAAEYWSH